MSRGFTDWQDLGIFPLQDVEDGVPVGMRMQVVGGRVLKRPEPGSGDENPLTEYAREDGLGTLGDIHPWHFWQTKEREKRAMGSWSMAWGALVVQAADTYYGGQAGVQPLTVLGNSQVNDIRYRVGKPRWAGALPWQPEGMLAMVMPSTDEVEFDSVMLSADRRLVASSASGPGQAGTTIVDMQPDGVLCMDGSDTPGKGGRHARLHGLVRVVALGQNSAPLLGGADLNGIALNYGTSQQDGILGYGMVIGPATDGGAVSTGQTGPVTPGAATRPSSPITPGASSRGFGGPPGTANSGEPDGPNADAEVPVGEFGQFSASPQGGYAIGFMHHAANGPISFGCQKHVLGVDKDGHKMTSAHIKTGAYFHESGDRDGPLLFEGPFPEGAGEHAIPTLVHLSWDKNLDHGFLGGSRQGFWRWWTTVPYVEAQEPPTGPTTPGGGEPGTPSGPSSPANPAGPARPTTPQGPGPSPPTGPGSPTTPGGATTPPSSPPTGGPPTPPPPPGRPTTPGAQPWPWWIYPGGPPTGARGPETPDSPTQPGRPTTPGARPGTTPPVAPGPDELPDLFRYRGPAGVVEQVGGTEGRVGLYGIHHPFQTSFASLAFRPQFYLAGAPHIEHNPSLGERTYRHAELTRPSVLTVRAWGAQNESGEWDYTARPWESKARGGTADGGILLAPPEFSMEDYLGINSIVDTDSPTTTAYAVVAPGVRLTFGAPTTGGVPVAGSKVFQQATATGELTVIQKAAAGFSDVEILALTTSGGTGRVDVAGVARVETGAAIGQAGDPDASAVLELESTSQGFLPPRMTTAQRTAISSPADGLLVFDTDIPALYIYEDGAWASLGGASGGSLEYGVIRGANANTTGQSGSVTYTKVTQLGTDVRSSANVTTSTANQITVGVDGLYRVSYSLSVYRTGASITQCDIAISVGGTEQADGRSTIAGISAAGAARVMANSTVLSLSASDVITLELKTDSATGTIVCYEATLAVELLPGQ